MGDAIILNTKDWPVEVQPYVDFVAAFDGEDGISTEDIALAKSYYNAVAPRDSAENIVSGIVTRSGSGIFFNPLKAIMDIHDLRNILSTKNPIHRLIAMERELIKPEKFEDTASKIYGTLINILQDVSVRMKPEMSPREKIRLVYESLGRQGFGIRKECVSSLFMSDVVNRSVDCDTSSFVVAAIAYELELPIYLVSLPGHTFIRWDDGVVKFNMDFGEETDDAFYARVTGFDNLDERKFRFEQADFYFYLTRANSRVGLLNQNELAIKDYREAIRLNPGIELADAYTNQAAAKIKLGQFNEARADLKEAKRLNPKGATIYNSEGAIDANLEKYPEAIEKFSHAIELNPDYIEALANRRDAHLHIANLEEALEDNERLSRIDPRYSLSERGIKILKEKINSKEYQMLKKEIEQYKKQQGSNGEEDAEDKEDKGWGCSPRW